MGATEEIIKMAKENNGTVTTAMIVAVGFSRGNPNKYHMAFPMNYKKEKP